MTQGQKVIKYIAMIFGVFLAVNIISMIIFGVVSIIGIGFAFDELDKEKDVSKDMIILQEIQQEQEIHNLEIDVKTSKLTIQKADKLKIESNGNEEYIQVKQNGDTLIIEDESRHFIKNQIEIILSIPENMTFDKVKLNTGLATTNIQYLKARQISFNIGVGNTRIKNITIEEKTTIKAGAGKVDITNASFKDLDLDTGIGACYLQGTIIGTSKINCGIGKTEISLVGGRQQYKMITKIGIGGIYIEGDKSSENTTYGNGKNFLDISGGIGKTEIYFED